MDAHATYVALTRHRKDVTLFYDTKTFPDFKGLQKSLSRVSNKDLVTDYTIRPEHQGAWENVQEYILLGRDLMSMVKENDWASYQKFKTERSNLGQAIISEWKEHETYAHQTGLSQESIMIACGLKIRPLSLIEEQAQSKVQAYSKLALESRLLWREIRKTHPGKQCYQHSRYAEFNESRLERNKLATEIVKDRPLYKEFVASMQQALGISWKTLNNQAKQDSISFSEHKNAFGTKFITEALKKFGLENLKAPQDESFKHQVQKLLERMPLWSDALGKFSLLDKRQTIETAIIAEAIKHEAKKEYCFLSTPLEAAVRSEGIAVATAILIKERDDSINLKKIMKEGVDVFNECGK